MKPWYHIDDIDGLDSPCLVVFPERVAANIRRMTEMVDDVNRLRPHIKTHKTAEGIRMMMDAGISRFKCATIAEAELLGRCGAPDVVLAYQPHGPKIDRLSKVIRTYSGTRYACLTDNPDSAAQMAAVFRSAGHTVPVYIDLNLGMNRSGIRPGEDVISLWRHCMDIEGIIPVGLHAYDGHHRHPDILERKAACDASFQSVDDLRSRINEVTGEVPVIIVGGSPTFPIHAARKDVECSPGTSIFWDACYAGICPEQPFEPAVALVTRVLSLPTETRVCTDLGHKSVAAENDIGRRVVFFEATDLTVVSQSEEHLVADAPVGHGHRPGDVLMGIPYHVCPTVALYERLPAIIDGKHSGDWKVVARDRCIGL
jgi:D-serine deaminase-like pyridoxal phosphate-dependent protein